MILQMRVKNSKIKNWLINYIVLAMVWTWFSFFDSSLQKKIMNF